jgi:N6-adenosine-specific RNA methylase IME4
VDPVHVDERIAKAADVSKDTVHRVREIEKNAPGPIKQAARSGDLSINAAYETTKAIARLPEPKRVEVVRRIEESPTTDVRTVIREVTRDIVVAKLEDVATREAKAASGVYDVIVLDPPWPMEKIERDVRPNQVAFDYPTMSEEDLRALRVPCADDCHVFVWTTHKFMPMALRLLDAWALKYVCAFVWHKPGGFQPIGLPQYNCEFALYARRGAPSFIDTKHFFVCFEAPRGKHTEKPEELYALLRRVTAGRRLDMFNRRRIEGFDAWGKEAPDVA